MATTKKTTTMRYEPAGNGVVRRKPITERNLRSPVVNPGADDDSDTFGTVVVQQVHEAAAVTTYDASGTRESSIVVRRDRTPKGVGDGRGKRSAQEMILSQPTPEEKAVYTMARAAALEDQIAKLLELNTDESREIIFKRRPSLKQYWDK